MGMAGSRAQLLSTHQSVFAVLAFLTPPAAPAVAVPVAVDELVVTRVVVGAGSTTGPAHRAL
jgi:hypothetical protein